MVLSVVCYNCIERHSLRVEAFLHGLLSELLLLPLFQLLQLQSQAVRYKELNSINVTLFDQDRTKNYSKIQWTIFVFVFVERRC